MQVHHVSISGELTFLGTVIQDEGISRNCRTDFTARIVHELTRVSADVHLDDVVVVQTTSVGFDGAGLVCDAFLNVWNQSGLAEIVEVGRNAPDRPCFAGRCALFDWSDSHTFLLKGP